MVHIKMKFDALTIKSRLFFSFGFLLALMVVLIGINIYGARKANQQLQGLVHQELLKYELISSIDSATKDNARQTLNLFVVRPEDRADVKQRISAAKTHIDDLFNQLEPLLTRPEGKAIFADMRDKRMAFVKSFTAARQEQENGADAKALAIVRDFVNPSIEALKKPVTGLLEFQKKIANERGQEMAAASDFQNRLSIGLGTLAVFLGMGAALIIIRSIEAPLKVANRVSAEIAKGNLDIEFDITGRNELTDLLTSMNLMKQFLAQFILQIQDSAAQVANASSEIAAANIDLSSRTQNQATSLEETAAAMEEMTSTVHSNAQITQSANHLTAEVSVSAGKVGGLVANVVTTMEEINSSSKRIQDIIGVIDSIAFQTNILALNAAVEAARAGEQGRGFAVVATEVRSLAQRSAGAAQEIKAIIQDNVGKISNGNDLASQAGNAVATVVESIQKVNISMSEVALATREQSEGIAQVGQAVAQIDQATQQNAALVEETAAASSNLNDQVQALKTAINFFKIGRLVASGSN